MTLIKPEKQKIYRGDWELAPHIARWIPELAGILQVIPLPLALVLAVIHTESSGWSHVWRKEPTSNTSWGLMGVCTETAAWLQTAQGRVVLRAKGFTYAQLLLTPGTLKQEELKDPNVNLRFGCIYLYYQYLRYRSYTKATAAYNAGHVKLRNGQYINQKYVETVTRRWKMYEKYLEEVK